jgi:hypothetical protein
MNCPQCDCYCPDDAAVCACGYKFPDRQPLQAKPEAEPDRVADPVAVKASGAMRKIFLAAMLVSLLFWVASLFFINRLPDAQEIFAPLLDDPVQSDENVPPPFTVQKNGLTYQVTPLFHYELSGLVVSQHRSDSLLDYNHRRWRDYLNIKDLCVVWGVNIENGVYRRITFWNRDFTCMCKFPDPETAVLFSARHLSNNHLLCVDKKLSRRILDARRGDQIHLKGFLAEYSQPANKFFRGSSTVRDDSGNGACETVFVTDFSILQRGNPVWRVINPLSLLAASAYLVAMVLLFALGSAA